MKPGVRKGLLAILVIVMLMPAAGFGKVREIDPYHWTGVEKIIVIGDLHGDYQQYLTVLRSAGLIDDDGDWAGGHTHLVQLGDIPDRGGETRKIMDHIRELKRQARRKGGFVHVLVGNHEAMNVYGDLRYVTPQDYAAFVGRNSERLQELQWDHQLEIMQANDPEGFKNLDLKAYRKEWEKKVPLGWVEQRTAWQPSGEYGKWVMDHPVAIEIDGTLFVHGGFSAKYCQSSLADLSDKVHDGLRNFDWRNPGILEDELGPLWYRGLAEDDEAKRADMVSAILARYKADRIVVGHTPTMGVVWPRFNGRVILDDTGISSYYGAHDAFLEMTPQGMTAHYGDVTLPVPTGDQERVAYLRRVLELEPGNRYLEHRLARLTAPKTPAQPEPQKTADTDKPLTEEQAAAAAEKAAEEAQQEAWLSPGNCQSASD